LKSKKGPKGKRGDERNTIILDNSNSKGGTTSQVFGRGRGAAKSDGESRVKEDKNSKSVGGHWRKHVACTRGGLGKKVIKTWGWGSDDVGGDSWAEVEPDRGGGSCIVRKERARDIYV